MTECVHKLKGLITFEYCGLYPNKTHTCPGEKNCPYKDVNKESKWEKEK